MTKKMQRKPISTIRLLETFLIKQEKQQQTNKLRRMKKTLTALLDASTMAMFAAEGGSRRGRYAYFDFLCLLKLEYESKFEEVRDRVRNERQMTQIQRLQNIAIQPSEQPKEEQGRRGHQKRMRQVEEDFRWMNQLDRKTQEISRRIDDYIRLSKGRVRLLYRNFARDKLDCEVVVPRILIRTSSDAQVRQDSLGS